MSTHSPCQVWIFDGGPQSRRWPRALRHALARRCVAAHAGVEVEAVEMGHAPSGQPLLLGPQRLAELDGLEGLAISLSDTQRYLAVALHAGGSVGIDIEPRVGRPVADGALPWLCAAEAAAIAAAPAAQRRESFIAVWTQKEAYLKALGCGLSGGVLGGLASFEVETQPTAAAALHRARAGAPPLRLHRIQGRDWLGAVACNSARPPTTTVIDFQENTP